MPKAPRNTVVRSIPEQMALGEARDRTYLAWRKAVKEKAPYEVIETLRWTYEDIQDQFNEYAPDIKEGWF